MGKRIYFKSNIAFIAWLKQKRYTKAKPPLTGIYTRGGTRVGSAYERRSKSKKIWEIDLY